MSGSWSNNDITQLVIPSGATSGERIEINVGQSGMINVFNSSGLLVASIGGASGAILTENGTTFVELVNGRVLVGQIVSGAPDTADAAGFNFATTNVGAQPYLVINSPLFPSGGQTDAAGMLFFPGDPGSGLGGPTRPSIQIIDNAASSGTDVQVSGSIYRVSLDGSTNEAWQTPALNSPYTNSTLQYRRTPFDDLVLVGSITRTTAATGAGNAALFTLPTGYRPKKTWNEVACRHSQAGVMMDAQLIVVNSSGVVTHFWPAAGLAANDVIDIKLTIPMGDIA